MSGRIGKYIVSAPDTWEAVHTAVTETKSVSIAASNITGSLSEIEFKIVDGVLGSSTDIDYLKPKQNVESLGWLEITGVVLGVDEYIAVRSTVAGVVIRVHGH